MRDRRTDVHQRLTPSEITSWRGYFLLVYEGLPSVTSHLGIALQGPKLVPLLEVLPVPEGVNKGHDPKGMPRV